MIKRICIDLDDTLVDWNGALRKWYNNKYGTNLKLKDFKSYFFNEVWGGTLQEAIDKVDIFNHSNYNQRILPLEYSREAINILTEQGRELFIATSRPDFLRDETQRLLNEFFKNKFSDVFYSLNHYSGRENSGKSKVEICKDLGAMLIDDSQDYVIQCHNAGIPTLLFGDYPWNQLDFNTSLIIRRAKNWKKVLECI